VLPICGILFLLATVGPFEQARFDAQMLEDSMPGHWEADIVNADRRHERTARTFGVLGLVVGGLSSGERCWPPRFSLKPHQWQLGWRMNGVGFAIALGGFFLVRCLQVHPQY
jgi:hypothetical protein